MTRAGATTRREPRRRGFTIIELLITILVLGTLIGLLLIAFGRASNTARGVVDEQTVRALGLAVDTFEQELGFLPPLVKDAKYSCGAAPVSNTDPIENDQPVVYSTGDPADLDYLRSDGIDITDPSSTDCRFSEYSLAYYLVGALGSINGVMIDGVDGPGFYEPRRNGTFKTTGGRRFEPLFNAGGRSGTLVGVDQNAGRWEIRDGNGTPFRFYRWERGKAQGAGQFDAGEIENTTDLNVPNVLGDPAESTRLRDATWAIVGAGPDGWFGDPGIEDMAELKQDLNTGSDDTALRRTRDDNVIEVGEG